VSIFDPILPHPSGRLFKRFHGPLHPRGLLSLSSVSKVRFFAFRHVPRFEIVYRITSIFSNFNIF
jgi:hypothetical protein